MQALQNFWLSRNFSRAMQALHNYIYQYASIHTKLTWVEQECKDPIQEVSAKYCGFTQLL